MKLELATWRELGDRHDRACARLATIALNDVVWGRARASLLAKRATQKMFPAEEIVGDIYSMSQAAPSSKWSVWECPECGRACLGKDAAMNCCSEEND